MNGKVILLLLWSLVCCGLTAVAQDAQKNEQQQKAEAEAGKNNVAGARYWYIRAFEDYAEKGRLDESVSCGVKAAELYSRESLFKEAFDFLRRMDQTIVAKAGQNSEVRSKLQYRVSSERLQMYMKFRKPERCSEQLAVMESQAALSGDESLKNDLLYNKTVYYYSFGYNDKGNATFKEMAGKLTATKEYDKVDEVYQTLIANGRRSNSASLVAQSYQSYLQWKDSVNALKSADEIAALKQKIADDEASIADKDSSLTARWVTIVGLLILAGVLAAALVVGGIVLLRYIVLTRKQKNTIKMVNENNALKAKFIGNISAQLNPALQRLDGSIPEVKALKDFAEHIQTLSELERTATEGVELEDVQIPQFCEGLMDQIRGKVKSGVNLIVNAPKMSAPIHREYVSHVLLHLLNNAAVYTPAGGSIWLDFKKRGAHAHQFLVSDTGCGIPEEERDNVFKPFLEIHDLTEGDGLGLPICKQMALKMDGDLTIDPAFTKGTRFVLNLHA